MPRKNRTQQVGEVPLVVLLLRVPEAHRERHPLPPRSTLRRLCGGDSIASICSSSDGDDTSRRHGVRLPQDHRADEEGGHHQRPRGHRRQQHPLPLHPLLQPHLAKEHNFPELLGRNGGRMKEFSSSAVPPRKLPCERFFLFADDFTGKCYLSAPTL